MRMRSTGLGKTELKAYLDTIEKVDDTIILRVQTTEPVRWKVRNLFQQEDITQLIKLLLKPSNLFFVLKALFKSPNKVNEPENF